MIYQVIVSGDTPGWVSVSLAWQEAPDLPLSTYELSITETTIDNPLILEAIGHAKLVAEQQAGRVLEWTDHPIDETYGVTAWLAAHAAVPS